MSTRRAFLRNVILALPAYSMAGMLLSSCGKEGNTPPINSRKKIGILGAGVSGLHAAMLLHNEQAYDIEILEASDRIGGRIQSENKLFGKYKSELGASTVFGRNTWHQSLSKTNALKLKNKDKNIYFSKADGEKSQLEMNLDSDYQKMEWGLEHLKVFQSTNGINYQTYLNSIGVPQRVQYIFEGKTESVLGGSLSQIDVNDDSIHKIDLIHEDQFELENTTFQSHLLTEYKNVLPFVVNNTKAVKIDYSGDKVKVIDQYQQTRTYDYLIITVPLSILKLEKGKSNHISFEPSLPQTKLDAMNQLGMGNGMTIHMKLNQKFWSGEAKQLYISSSVKKLEVVYSNEVSSEYVLKAEIMGSEMSNAFYNLSEREIIEEIKKEWQNTIEQFEAGSIVSYQIKKWGEDEHIQGCISYSSEGADNNTRMTLAQNIQNKLYFAGEACNTNMRSGTIDGAIETSIKSVQELLKNIKTK